jgi:hypothetical protein
MKQAGVIVFFAIVLAVAGCDDGYLRGAVSRSPDGKTYFAVIDDNGGHCGPLKLDGVVWPHAIGEVVEISPGKYTLECGAPISFEVPPGVILKFDYWGP